MDEQTHGDPLADTHALGPLAAEARIFHHYEVELRPDGLSLLELGRGAMGVTYKARDVNLDAPVALKVINAQYSDQATVRERFRREARAAAQLRHPHVASVFHFGETPGGQCFYAMEFIEGETLEAKVRREGPQPVALVLEIAHQITDALIAADRRGLIHRDLKPGNLMLTAPVEPASKPETTVRPGSTLPPPVFVKVIDFGLAKAVSAAADSEGVSLTQGGFVGTPQFASPEQVDGGDIDTRADIFSLGATLWFLLTARVPFTGRSLGEIYDRQLHRPLPLAQLADARVPAPLAKLLESMLAADPEQRPASPLVLQEALEKIRAEIGGSSASLRALEPATRLPPSRRNHRGLAASLVTLLLVLGVAALGWFFLRQRVVDPSSSTALPEKSIAVLPLENLSDDKENAFFADGIQDDVLASLAKIKELKVIARASVSSYKANLPRNLREIGAQLGVTHVLAGSVRRVANRVLVNVELVDTRNGRQLWAERYDRTLADSLTLQGELATEIAAALRANLSPAEKARVEEKPTGNPEAYVLYLRARDYESHSAVEQLQDLLTAEQLYEQAVALDPGFALGHARLSMTVSKIFAYFQPTDVRKLRARAAAAEALRLRPTLGEGHLALGAWFYWTERDYAHALQEFDLAARALPNDVSVRSFVAAVHHGQGRFGAALAGFEQVLALDPRNAKLAGRIAFIHWGLRDWPAAAAAFDHTVALAPDQLYLKIMRAYVDWSWKADAAPLQATLAAVPPGLDPDGIVTFARWDISLDTRDFAAAERALAACQLDPLPMFQGTPVPKAFLAGCIALAQGQTERAHAFFEVARLHTEAEVQASPQDATRHADLGLLYAYLGRKEEALREGRRAVELAPESKTAALGPSMSACLALIYARVGEPDQAIPLIQRLLTTPNADFGESNITLTELRQGWKWDPLRDDPRFQKILAGPEPKTIYK